MINNKTRLETLRSFTQGVQSRILAVVLMMTIFATSVFAAFTVSYTVDIIDDGAATQVTTTRSEPVEILAQCEIVLGDKDKLDISEFESGNGGKIVISRAKNISVDYCGTLTNYEIYSSTVKSAIEEVGIALPEGSEVNFPMTDKAVDGMVLSIVVPNPVQITADGVTKAVVALNDTTVAQLLADNGITLGAEDIVTPALETPVQGDMSIVVNRVAYQDIVETQGIPRKTVTKRTASLAKGQTQVQTEGSDGVKDVTFKIKTVDGVEVERTFVSENITAPAVNKVVLNGTKSVIAASAPVIDSGTTTQAPPIASTSNPNRKYTYRGNTMYEGQTLGGRASHYCACATCNGSNSGTTTSGMRIYNGMANPYIVACNWLPIGTKLLVNGVHYSVMDRGGSGLSVIGRLDVFTPGGHAECYRLGVKNISIQILSLGATN